MREVSAGIEPQWLRSTWAPDSQTKPRVLTRPRIAGSMAGHKPRRMRPNGRSTVGMVGKLPSAGRRDGPDPNVGPPPRSTHLNVTSSRSRTTGEYVA
jgi:hypothetical protein